jgi:hypothetical protein
MTDADEREEFHHHVADDQNWLAATEENEQ